MKHRFPSLEQRFACMEAREISLSLGGQRVLKPVSFSACAGELVVIIGPNGAGKSSLLRLLAGEYSPDHGELVLHDEHLSIMSLEQRATHVSVLSQNSRLNFPFTVEQVVAMGRMPFSLGHQADTRICEQAMQASDCYELRKRVYTQLSGGEQQRCQLARVFAQSWPTEEGRPNYLLLDEPNNCLDLSHQKMLLDYCRHRTDDNAVVLMVLHDLNLAFRYADRILLMHDGRLYANGSPWEVVEGGLLESVYGVKLHYSTHPEKNVPMIIM
ncbi:heme ABC transporter ATP-binding protein [Pseudoteredinibacter isoporae]|uniref:heme ABC transporter ATP-binding protein n=1 Tax=Pseudoteredinibacter isoporae TaxID=570281 RepID=UPI0031086820